MIKLNTVLAHLGLLLLCVTTYLTSAVAVAESYVPYKIKMERKDPNRPLRKSTIMAKVKKKYPGRILYIAENAAGGPDCHIVKLMGNDGEFRIIHVACN
ncbi:MAG: hypothetical protein CR991_10105 [Proteobacteria bacterium]|nr:MAG: hypothetical protein CR991_10105 [Pseudomonadota bacterium]